MFLNQESVQKQIAAQDLQEGLYDFFHYNTPMRSAPVLYIGSGV